MTPTNEAVDATAFVSDLTKYTEPVFKVIDSFRFFKLLRLVKLYTFCSQGNNNDDVGDEGESPQKNSETAQQAALKKELDPNALGKLLSSTTTRKILIAVILMYIAIPLLTYSSPNTAFVSMLRTIFYAGSCSCTVANNPFCNHAFITSEGWRQLLMNIVDTGKDKSTSTPSYEVLWLSVPNFNNHGIIEDILEIRADNGMDIYWKQTDSCAGKVISTKTDCPYRTEEMKLFYFTPEDCQSGLATGCEDLTIYVRVSTRNLTDKYSLYAFIMTLVTMVLLFTAAVSVGNDTSSVVVNPTSRMIKVITKITNNPLQPQNPPAIKDTSKEEEEENARTLQTARLEKVLYDISRLLQIGYGRLGAKIIRENMLTGEGDVNIMVPGVKIQTIFLICRVNKFADISECLQEEIIVFINRFAKIIHECGEFWGGSANNNTGEVFLLTWKLPVSEEQASAAKKQQASDERTMISIKALVAALKIQSEIR